jgi:preprotein translocase subunit SecE
MSFVGKIKKFAKEVSVEMKKVTWPTKAQLKESTTVVVVLCALFAIFTFVVDQAVTFLIEKLY